MNATKRLMTIAGAGMMTLMIGCSDHDHDHDGHDHTTSRAERQAAAVAVASAVSWPALSELDHLIHDAEDMILRGEIDELRAMAPEFARLVREVAEGDLPENVRNAEEVRLLQRDLVELVASLQREGATDQNLVRDLSGIIALTEELMKSAGVPHVHDHGHDHDHGHEGHVH